MIGYRVLHFQTYAMKLSCLQSLSDISSGARLAAPETQISEIIGIAGRDGTRRRFLCHYKASSSLPVANKSVCQRYPLIVPTFFLFASIEV